LKIVIATDSFKGTLTSYEAGVAICEGIKAAGISADIRICEAADGGEGTADIITRACGGTVQTVTVTGPLSEMKVDASYGIVSGNTAVIDISSACGLALLNAKDRNPLYTTTRGVGELIRDALAKGCRRFIIGLGGSSTNDCGAGMLSALGIKILNKDGEPVSPGAAGLGQTDRIDTSSPVAGLTDSEFLIACDVNNPLTGNNGCSMVFAPQKGADDESCRKMDDWATRFARIAGRSSDFPGAGAAGGLGYAFGAFLNGKLVSGARLVTEQIRLEEELKDADIVITGEGRIDSQTAMGKLPYVIAGLAYKHGCRVIAFAGKVECDKKTLSECGIDEVYSISEGISEAESMNNAASCLTAKVKEVFDGRPV
jgi:glycerate kinase